jgi:putative N-acetylmannosamine-6-phosphate epimerase
LEVAKTNDSVVTLCALDLHIVVSDAVSRLRANDEVDRLIIDAGKVDVEPLAQQFSRDDEFATFSSSRTKVH